MAELLEQRAGLGLGERTAELRLAVLDPRRQIVAQLGGDVVGLGGGQGAPDRVEIAFEQVHHLSLSVRRRIDSEIAFHSPRSCASTPTPSGLRR